MNFLGVILLPFTLIYNAVTRFRNYLYDSGYWRSFSFQTNVISVGNLAVGGTGKSPMVEYLVRLLRNRRLVTLSRGYGRKTRGFRIASQHDSPSTLGDEPFQFYSKFPAINVAVGEERAIAIPFILAELPETEIILLDDAFQHRPVKPNLNILLTDYSRPFFKDYVLPSGRLRENRDGAARADVIVVTKCPQDAEYEFYQKKIRKYNKRALIAFAAIRYLEPKPVAGNKRFCENVFLVSGIANPEPLKTKVSEAYQLVGSLFFGDHHHYTVHDLGKIKHEFEKIAGEDKCLLTTEKDMVKLKPLMETAPYSELPLFYIPIETFFVKGGEAFDKIVLDSIVAYDR